MSLHSWLGRHVADLKTTQDGGYFVSRCVQCQRPMIKLPGLPWRLR